MDDDAINLKMIYARLGDLQNAVVERMLEMHGQMEELQERVEVLEAALEKTQTPKLD